MGPKKPRIVIIGAGMAGLAAASKLCADSGGALEVSVVEAGARIGGRVKTSEFGLDRVELGATWIHGVVGSPVYEIASRIGALCSDRPWECMDGPLEVSRTVAEDGSEVGSAVCEPVTALFDSLMDFARGKVKARVGEDEGEEFREVAVEALEACRGVDAGNPSIGSFLRKGLEIYWRRGGRGEDSRRRLDEEAVFAMNENVQRTYTSAGELTRLDFLAESEYVACGGEEITIAGGYSSVVESLAFGLPTGTVQLGREVVGIEWLPLADEPPGSHPVTLRFRDGATVSADHVIVTVSLGVLKARTGPGSSLFSPPLPPFKADAISRLGFGTVNKLFLRLPEPAVGFPVLQMAFRRPGPESPSGTMPWWMSRTASLAPIHRGSDIMLSWFAGEEALHLETLSDEEVLDGVSSTVRPMISREGGMRFEGLLRSGWGSDPLFLGSYSYVAVGSSGDDLDALAEPLPRATFASHPLQVMFAGEATHRTHYSTTHGAYFSGIREATRLLQYYKCV